MGPPIFRLISQNEISKMGKLTSDNIQNSYDKDGYTPLTKCCILGRVDMVTTMLVSIKVDPNELDQNGKAALHYAAMDGSEELFKLLLNKGACLSLADKDGRLAFHHACEKSRLPLIKYILEFSPEIDDRDRLGKSPLDLARERGHSVVVKMLEKHFNLKNDSGYYDDCEPFTIKQLLEQIKELQAEVKAVGQRMARQEKTSQGLERTTSSMMEIIRKKETNTVAPGATVSLPSRTLEKAEVPERNAQSECKSTNQETGTSKQYTLLKKERSNDEEYENVANVARHGGVYTDTIVDIPLTQAQKETIEANFSQLLQSFEIEEVRYDLVPEFLSLDMFKKWRHRKVSSEAVIEHILLDKILDDSQTRLEKLTDILKKAGKMEAVKLLTPQ